MSTIQDNQAPWTNLPGQQLDSKYEKCRNITEEIYKRINITFQIKKLETGNQSDIISDNSDQIDSNELSNETDLFACDKSDISSSTEGEKTANTCPPAFVNFNNNNEERNKSQINNKPRKRFRKRVKKRPPNRKRSDSEGSSDEAPLSRSVLILSPDMKAKPSMDKKPLKSRSALNNLTLRELLKPTNNKVPTVLLEKIQCIENEVLKNSKTIDKTREASLTDDRAAKISEKAIIETIETVMSIDKKKERGLDISKQSKNLESAIVRDKDLSITELDKKSLSKDVKITDWKNCSLCSLSFRGDRGLRRHMSMSHLVDGNK